MYTAAEVGAMLEAWKKRGDSKPEIIRELSESCLGWPYVYAAAGEMCTPSWRRNRMGYSNEKYAAAIKDNCPVLSGKRTSSGADAPPSPQGEGYAPHPSAAPTPSPQGEDLCDGCKWDGCRCFDCRGFTRWLLAQVGLSLAGGGATTQWETASNWAAKGEIGNIPRGLVCCVFKRKDGKMSHTGMYQGYGEIIHCSTTVKRDKLPGTPAWTHFGIPAGLYTDEELRKAGVNVSEGQNIPTLRRGSSGSEVEALQALLNARFGANLETDGVFGAKTEAAVKAFQKNNGLAADGAVGPKTRAALGLSELAPTGYGAAQNDGKGDTARHSGQAGAGGRGEEAPTPVTLPRLTLLKVQAALSDCLDMIIDVLEESEA